MENKKSSLADLRKKSGLFLNIGFVISLIFVLLAFEYKSYNDKNPIPLDLGNTDFPDMPANPQTVHEPPPPKKQLIIEIENEEKKSEGLTLLIDNETTEETNMPDFAKEDIPTEKPEEIFIVVEQMPSYPGGMKAFFKLFSEKIKYPSRARNMGIEGKVTLSFIIDKDGSIY